MKNSYFSLNIEENGIYIKYYPAVDGGEELSIDDVTNYLARNNITEYNVKVINEVIKDNKERTELISISKTFNIDESVEIFVSPDNMYAVAKFYPPSNKGNRMNQAEIKTDLNMKKITYGIDEAAIEKFISEPEYMKKIVIAKGLQPVQGHDAVIDYKFNTDRKAKPQLNEDGTVDFHRLNNISNVQVGDILAVLTPEDMGTPGKDVFGAVVMPRKVNRLALRYGNGIQISEDGCTLTSLVDGHVTLDGDRVSVSNVYDVPADVDNSTGDIEFNGGIEVKGNVRTGFKLRARGNIEIHGVVEGAIIIADGDVILHRGVQGMGRCQIIAGGNLVSKFIESANVAVNGYIETDTILHSQVAAKGDIYVRGKNGNIIGGNVRSTTLIEATCIGSPMGTTTNVEVGNDPAIMDKMNNCKKEIMEKTKEKDTLTQSIAMFKKKLELGKLDKTKLPQMQTTAKNILALEEAIAKLTEEYEKYSKKLSSNKNAKINIVKTIYQGCKVTVSGDYILIHEEYAHCSFKKDNAEIKSVPL